jgi:Flp pilus assembly protein CpaB
VTNSRLRSLLLPLALAVVAALLIGIYIVSYRNNVKNGAGLVKVLVAARDIPAGTEGSAVASGGYLKEQTVPRRAVIAGSVVSAAPLTSKVVTDRIYEGQQITVRQFGPIAQGGVFAKFSGKERAVAVLGQPYQLLEGTLEAGDRVDVVATARYRVGSIYRTTSRVVLQNLLVLEAPDPEKVQSAQSDEKFVAKLVMTDSQTKTMGWAMRMSTWFLALRPTSTPSNSKPSLETLHSFLDRGIPSSRADAVIEGDFKESVDEP